MNSDPTGYASLGETMGALTVQSTLFRASVSSIAAGLMSMLDYLLGADEPDPLEAIWSYGIGAAVGFGFGWMFSEAAMVARLGGKAAAEAKFWMASVSLFFAGQSGIAAYDSFQNGKEMQGYLRFGMSMMALFGAIKEFGGAYNEATNNNKLPGGNSNVSGENSKKPLGNSNISNSGGGNKSPKGLIGTAFEEYLTETIGGDGSFSVEGREFDGGLGNRWWEAKSGRYWEMISENKGKMDTFKSSMGHGLRIAKDHGATYELFSNTPIPDDIKIWLNKKGIQYTEMLD